MNSAYTRRMQRLDHLEREQALVVIFQKMLDSIELTSPEIEEAVDGQRQRLERARRKHSEEQRAYYGTFGELLRWYLEATDTLPEIRAYDREEMKGLLIELADEHLDGVDVFNPDGSSIETA